MNYYQIPNDPRNTLLNVLKDQKVKNEEKDEKEKKSFFEKEFYVGPLEKARRQRQAGQTIDSVNEQPEIQKPAIPVMATSNQNQSDGLLSEKDEKEVKERINKDIETKAKYTKAGDFFANLGGLNRVLSKNQQAELQQSSPEDYNKVRLAARNKGIGEMLLLLSDALGGRDIAGRAMERRIAERPEKKDLTAAQQNLRAFQEISKTGTPDEIAIAQAALIGTRMGKSKEQLRNEVIASLAKQIDSSTGEPLSKEDIEQQIKILDIFYGSSNNSETDSDSPLSFEIPGYSIEEIRG